MNIVLAVLAILASGAISFRLIVQGADIFKPFILNLAAIFVALILGARGWAQLIAFVAERTWWDR